MLVTNGSTKGCSQKPEDSNKKDSRARLPVPLKYILKLVDKLIPRHIPVAIKLAISIGIMLTLVMTLLGAVIVHNQTNLIRTQITNRTNTLVQTHANSLGDLITQAQMSENPDNTHVSRGKPDPMGKQNLLLTLKVITTQLTNDKEIVGAAIYSSQRKELSKTGINPFDKNAPYAGKEASFLKNESRRILEWGEEYIKQNKLNPMTFISPIYLQNTVVGYALITFKHDLLDQAIANAVQSIVIATLIMILLGIMLSYILGRRLTKPLYLLTEASEAIARGNYNHRLPEQRNDEIGYLMTSFNNMAQGLYQKERVEKAFSRHVAPSIAKEIIDNMEDLTPGGKHVRASVLFVDIVGFTSISETMTPEGIAQLLNEFYTNINKVSQEYNGVIDKFMGDCAMAVFGIPNDDQEHAYNSIACAVTIQKLLKKLNKSRKDKRMFPISFRIGVNTGEMLAGNMGSAERTQYTVVGDSVNLASRLCTVAPSDKIIISGETCHLTGMQDKIVAVQHERMRIRGVTNPVNTYLVEDLKEPYLQRSNEIIEKIIKGQKKQEAVNK